MNLIKLHDPNGGRMIVAGFMSGSGSNLVKIIEAEKALVKERGTSPYHMAVIFSDRASSNALQIGIDYGIPTIINDISKFYSARGKPLKDMAVRAEFDKEIVKALANYKAKVAAYGGYMSIATNPLMAAFLGVNVHPADLSIIEGNKRKYTGDHAVIDAILAGEEYIRASTHIIEPQVDYGRILMISAPLELKLRKNWNPKNKKSLKKAEDNNQDRLKKIGDHVIFPKTLLHLAEGRYAEDDKGRLYFDEKIIPDGLKLEE